MTAFSRRPLLRLRPLVHTLVAGLWLGCVCAHAQAQGMGLRSSPRLQESLSPEESRRGGLHVSGEHITARPDMDLVLEGQAEIRRPGMVVRAGRIEYDQTQDLIQAEGQVHVNRQGNVFEGPRLQLQADSFRGQFETPRYSIIQGGHGDAQQLDFVDPQRMVLRQARYTTCRATPGPEWLPEWLLKATTLRTDTVEDTGVAEGVQVEFKGWRTPTLPDLSFSLSAARKSGLLAPLFGVDTASGIDIQQPYYWNIAPNRDATLTTRLMSLRGAALESDFRYLENDYRGQTRLNWMPWDSLRKSQRWGLSAQHNGTLDGGSTLGPLGLGLSLNRVSDDNYWRDFPRSGSGSNIALTQRLLPSNANLFWSQDQLSMQMRVLKWQTLQDITSGSFIKPPYDRDPQLTLRYGAWQPSGLDWSVTADTTRFVADFSRLPASYGSPTNGDRSYMQAQVSQTWNQPWGFVTPKLQLHATRYQMQNPLADGNSSVNRSLPTLSLDSGLVFERETQWFGKGLTQTLEPRLFYAYTPYQNQSALPNYDSGLADFSLTTIYSENPYVGQDRIVDNNALTLGVNSRLFDSSTGAELLRVGMAQRIRFAPQRVTLMPGMAGDRSGLSDLLVGASTRWNDQLTLDSAVQLNNDTHQVTRATVQARYNPGPYRLLNAAYRLNRGVSGITDPSELVDVGWQWPLSDLRWGERPDDSGVRSGGQGLGADRWYGVGRMNYSLLDKKPVDTLIGFEYDAGCWLGRIVLERLQSTVATATTRLLFQIELVGFARVGASPLDSLRNNIPRYQYLRDTTSTPSRFLHYE